MERSTARFATRSPTLTTRRGPATPARDRPRAGTIAGMPRTNAGHEQALDAGDDDPRRVTVANDRVEGQLGSSTDGRIGSPDGGRSRRT
jgi:hypothetical protein